MCSIIVTNVWINGVDIGDSESETDDEDVLCETDKHSQIFHMNYIFCWSVLFNLFQSCLICDEKDNNLKVVTRGTVLIVRLLCNRVHDSEWHSQKRINSVANGDLLKCILFSGNSFFRIKEMMTIFNIN